MKKPQLTQPISLPALEPFKVDDFWMPSASPEQMRAEAEEFARQFGLMPGLAEFFGLRGYLREDTLVSVN